MSTLSAEQRSNYVIAHGRTLVKVVEGADYLYPDSRRADRLVLKIALVPADIGAEILAGSENITEPVGEVNLN
jgi:hypothetical protein